MDDYIECLSCPALKLCASQLYKVIDTHRITGDAPITLSSYCAIMNAMLEHIHKKELEN